MIFLENLLLIKIFNIVPLLSSQTKDLSSTLLLTERGDKAGCEGASHKLLLCAQLRAQSSFQIFQHHFCPFLVSSCEPLLHPLPFSRQPNPSLRWTLVSQAPDPSQRRMQTLFLLTAVGRAAPTASFCHRLSLLCVRNGAHLTL